MASAGDKIKVLSNHWARPDAIGYVVENIKCDELVPPVNRVLVKFVKSGVGLSEYYLYLDDHEFKIIKSVENAKKF